MSHFTVMVIGENPEEQLSMFDENLEYLEYCMGEVSDEDKHEMLDYYRKQGLGYKSFDDCYEAQGEDWNSKSYRKSDVDGVWRSYSTYNPNAKWDWYQLGGRWSGEYLTLKPGAFGICGEAGVMNNPVGIDAAYKRDIDFERIYREAYERGLEEYNKVTEAMGGTIPVPEFTWDSLFQGEFEKMDPKERRAKYNAQPAVKLFQEKVCDFPFGPELEDYLCTAEEYAQRKKESALSTYAYVLNGEWFEIGEMGWFGVSANKMSQEQWNAQVNRMLESLPDNALISIYDCHI